MWVVVVSDSLSEIRDNKISNLIGEKISEKYLFKLIYDRWSSTSYIGSAQIYKKESTVKNIVERFEKITDRDAFKSEFYYIRNSMLSYRKLSREEWNSYINLCIEKEKIKHSSRIKKLEKKRLEFK